jgi:hypothetical protein
VEETTVKRAASEINNNNNNVRVVDMNKVGKEAVVEEQDISVLEDTVKKLDEIVRDMKSGFRGSSMLFMETDPQALVATKPMSSGQEMPSSFFLFCS